jgi:hypothetical protein
MRLEETKIKLDSMLNQTYRFSQDNKLHTIQGYEVIGNSIIIQTDVQNFSKPIEGTNLFLSAFRKEETQLVTAQQSEPAWKTKMNENIEKLGATLFDNLEKLKTDPNFVDQAREINNHVNTIINVAKLQIQLNK